MTNPTELIERLSKDKWHVSGVDIQNAINLIESLVAERDSLRKELLTAHCQYEDWTKERTELKAKLEESSNKLEVARQGLQAELDYQFDNYGEVAPWIRKALATLQGE